MFCEEMRGDDRPVIYHVFTYILLDCFCNSQNFETFPKSEDGAHITMEQLQKCCAHLVAQGTVTEEQVQDKLQTVLR